MTRKRHGGGNLLQTYHLKSNQQQALCKPNLRHALRNTWPELLHMVATKRRSRTHQTREAKREKADAMGSLGGSWALVNLRCLIGSVSVPSKLATTHSVHGSLRAGFQILQPRRPLELPGPQHKASHVSAFITEQKGPYSPAMPF